MLDAAVVRGTLPRPKTTFGKTLRAWRIDNDLTQQELAARLGVRKGTVSDWELGRKHPSGATLRRMLKLVGASAKLTATICTEYALR